MSLSDLAHISTAVAVGVSIASIGCADAKSPSDTDRLRTRAKFDLQCDEVHLYYVDEGVTGVKGCGQQVTYVQSCRKIDAVDEDCKWILNTDSSRVRAQ